MFVLNVGLLTDVYSLLYCSCHVVIFPAYYFKVLNRCYVASAVLMFMYWGWCFYMFFVPFLKSPR